MQIYAALIWIHTSLVWENWQTFFELHFPASCSYIFSARSLPTAGTIKNRLQILASKIAPELR